MSVIDIHLASLPEPARSALEDIRSIVLKTLPEVKEVISYGMPGFTYHGKYLAGFDAFKDHLSFFPTAHPIEVHQHLLGSYKHSKGTIQFNNKNPLPEQLIVALITTRATAIDKH